MKSGVACLLAAVLVLTVTLSACTKQDTAKQPSESAKLEPVTLIHLSAHSDQVYQQRFLDNPALKKQLPNVTLVHMLPKDLDARIASGETPDIVGLAPQGFFNSLDAGLGYDMTELIKKHNFDISGMDAKVLDKIRAAGGGKLVAVPFRDNPYVIFGTLYNKDLFDRFAVPYPKDNMTWEDIIALSKRFDRVVDGEQYQGLLVQNAPVYMMQQIGASYVNARNQAAISGPLWEKVFRTFNELPNNTSGNLANYLSKLNTAMFVGVVQDIVTKPEKYPEINWDIVSYPTFPEAPKTVPNQFGILGVTASSKHKDEAFQFIQFQFSKDFAELAIKEYENPVALTKNIKVLKDRALTAYFPTKYDSDFNGLLNKAIKQMVDSGTDINTAMRDLQEQMQKVIDEKSK
jgi:multiple sugar transport system substrate-binding protein